MLLFSASREHLRREVWNKGQAIPGVNPDRWRKDADGWIMHYADHGNHASPYCWEMRQAVPKRRGGADALFNLLPRNASRNRESQDPRPWARHR